MLKRRHIAIAGIAVLGAAAVAVQAAAVDTGAGGGAKARLHDAQGNFLGSVHFLPRPNGKLAVRAATAFLPPGFHGFHIHAVGRCEAPFTSAGGHFNPRASGHGGHAGDLPVLLVSRDGAASAEFQTDGFSVDELLDADGSAVIVHVGPDNYANVPARYSSVAPDATTLATGDAGGRLACGVVTRSAS